ncbi:MAG: hypothetical protein J6S60_00685 [Oscillospiraceae bacterium]|nr:hypothetical protein [Oscillospiraceae bacterium]
MMRKFLRVCRIISRILIVLSVAAILALYYFRPESLAFLRIGGGAAAESFWMVFGTTLAMAAVMLAASDWAFTSVEEKDFLATLSSTVLRPCYEAHDLSDKHYSKAASADELDFNASLREVTDGRERVMQELAWERKNNKRLKSKATGNGIISVVFFVAGLFFLIYPIVLFAAKGQLLTLPDGSFMPYFTIAAVILTLLILCDNVGYRTLQRRLNTVLSIRLRNDGLEEARASVPALAPAATPVPAPAPAAAPAAPAPVPEEPISAPAPAEADPVEEDRPGSLFESLSPEEEDTPDY